MKKCYTLTRQEVAGMLVRQIGIFKEESMFWPYKIINSNIELPETIHIEMEMIPRGSTAEEGVHEGISEGK